jgi:hypothetical protein
MIVKGTCVRIDCDRARQASALIDRGEAAGQGSFSDVWAASEEVACGVPEQAVETVDAQRILDPQERIQTRAQLPVLDARPVAPGDPGLVGGPLLRHLCRGAKLDHASREACPCLGHGAVVRPLTGHFRPSIALHFGPRMRAWRVMTQLLGTHVSRSLPVKVLHPGRFLRESALRIPDFGRFSRASDARKFRAAHCVTTRGVGVAVSTESTSRRSLEANEPPDDVAYGGAVMGDREKYGRHLKEIVQQIRALPATEQQSQALRRETMKHAVSSGVQAAKAPKGRR